MRRSQAALILGLIAVAIAVLFYAGWRMTQRQQQRTRHADAGPGRPPPAPESVPGPDVFLDEGTRVVPGERPTPILGYRHPKARAVAVCGSWSRWSHKHPLTPSPAGWTIDVRALGLTPGRYEFKFLPDGEWEAGANRVLHISDDGWLARPPDLVQSARIEDTRHVAIHFNASVADLGRIRVRFAPEVPIESQTWGTEHGNRRLYGYAVAGNQVVFCFDEAVYGVELAPGQTVTVAGTFNGWNAGSPLWRLADGSRDGVWEAAFALDDVARGGGAGIQFKFVVDGQRWLPPPAQATNVATLDGHANLLLLPTQSAAPTLHVRTRAPLPLDRALTAIVEGAAERPLRVPVSPGGILDRFHSTKPLGALLDRDAGRTVFRVFAPRASRVDLLLSTRPDPAAPPAEVAPMARDTDGVWEAALAGLRTGMFYAFRVDGPSGPGEEFDPGKPVGDPYARASAHAHNLPRLIDPDARTEWFGGWTDAGYRPPAAADAFIYEAHVRDLTIDASSGVTPLWRGKYAGLAAGGATNTVLRHLRELGVNMIELLPVAEFDNGTNDHGWGYSPVYYFAPEASYGTAPLLGSAYYEFQALVDALHREGFGVILDVVFNHVGSPNLFFALDRPYYFRHGPDFTLSNFSGCGNDLRTEAPMLRRLIVDNVLYWMREHHVDGFRFDLADLIDMTTLRLVEQEARRLNPNVLLISEPWSFRGDHKRELKGTGWAAWNDEFREAVKRFARGDGDRAALERAIAGSTASWTAHPLQSVNYVESHDDMCLADELSSRPDHDGRVLTAEDAARNRLAATVLFTSLGIPMIAEGQEFLRSKHGIRNTYNRGDAVNALRWTDRDRPLAAETLAYYQGLAALRRCEAGRAFRLSGPVPAEHYVWLDGPSPRAALGYIVNGGRQAPGGAFVVLLNATRRVLRFEVPFPRGPWRLVADGRHADPAGVPDATGEPPAAEGGRLSVAVPALSARVFVSEAGVSGGGYGQEPIALP